MISENFEEMFQLIKTKENTKMRDAIHTIGFLSIKELYKSYVYEHYFFYSTMSSLTFNSFRAFSFSIFLL